MKSDNSSKVNRNRSVLKILWKNHEYILYYAGILLKQRVAGSYLGFLWLILQPLMFMLIYTFVVTMIFQNRMEHFNIYVLIGLNAWTLFQRSVMMAATAIVRNKVIFEQVYFHKSVYPSLYLASYVYEFLISTSLVFVMMFFNGIPFTWHIIEIIPVLLATVLFTYGCSLIIAHIGVYLFDLANILEFVLRFMFYLSPIMWNFANLNFRGAWVVKLNPMYVLIGSFRSCLLYGKSPVYGYLLIIAIVSCVLIQVGYSLISRYENEYARII
ncbi:MAG: ABC transporter permease [Firmicutes bacterium]|nr:ABC transporter permease [Bacillota bacterium]